MVNKLNIREANVDDFERIILIQRCAYLKKEAPLYGYELPPLKEKIEDLIEVVKDGIKIFVAEIENKIVGSVRIESFSKLEAGFSRLSVDPEYQGQGIGKKLAAYIEVLYPMAKYYILECGVDSLENLYIYDKLGYKSLPSTRKIENGPLVVKMRKFNEKYKRNNHV